jgi:hypothetical protein
MRGGSIIAGVLLIIAGVVWMLQGMGSTLTPQSFMTNTKIWIPLGAATATAGVWLIRRARKRTD